MLDFVQDPIPVHWDTFDATTSVPSLNAGRVPCSSLRRLRYFLSPRANLECCLGGIVLKVVPVLLGFSLEAGLRLPGEDNQPTCLHPVLFEILPVFPYTLPFHASTGSHLLPLLIIRQVP